MHKFFFRLKAFRHQCLRHWLDLPPRHTYNFRGQSYKKWLGMSFQRQSGKHQTNANCNNNNSVKNSNNQIPKDYKYDACTKTSFAQYLKIQINSVPDGNKDHKCDSCEKSFSQARTLKLHIDTVHNGQKDHKCDFCGKAFSQAGPLKTHRLLMQFIMVKKITNVTHVERHFLYQVT